MTEIIPNQEMTTKGLPDQFLKVYRWASENTAETRQFSKDDQTTSYKYFWPSPASVLLDSLKLSRGQLVSRSQEFCQQNSVIIHKGKRGKDPILQKYSIQTHVSTMPHYCKLPLLRCPNHCFKLAH
jgi:hypothetical protein